MIQSVSPEEIRRVTESVLSQPEYQKSFSAWQILWDGFGNFLGKVSQWAAQNPDMAKVLTFVLTILLILILGHIAYTIGREFRSLRSGSGEAAGRASAMQALEGIADNWADAFRMAREALESGDLYRALWIGHRVMLSAMDRMDVLRFAKWKTNGDYLGECRGNHSASRTLADVSAAYESVVYAHNDMDRTKAEALLLRVESLVEEASQ